MKLRKWKYLSELFWASMLRIRYVLILTLCTKQISNFISNYNNNYNLCIRCRFEYWVWNSSHLSNSAFFENLVFFIRWNKIVLFEHFYFDTSSQGSKSTNYLVIDVLIWEYKLFTTQVTSIFITNLHIFWPKCAFEQSYLMTTAFWILRWSFTTQISKIALWILNVS